MPKKEGIFCKIVFVAVRWYCRERFRKKQATARKTQCFSHRFYLLPYTAGRDIYPLYIAYRFFLLAVDRLFRQSEETLRLLFFIISICHKTWHFANGYYLGYRDICYYFFFGLVIHSMKLHPCTNPKHKTMPRLVYPG